MKLLHAILTLSLVLALGACCNKKCNTSKTSPEASETVVLSKCAEKSAACKAKCQDKKP